MPRPLNMVTINCQVCHSDFVVKYGERNREFCSKSCASKGRTRKASVKKPSVCLICNKDFNHYGQRVVCSRVCNSAYMSQTRVGEHNPAFNPNKRFDANCLQCRSPFQYTRSGMQADSERAFCSKLCWDKFQRGKNKTFDGPATCSDPYPMEFTPALKRRIRKRDNHTCCLCGKAQKGLSVHHIDYVKENCDDHNFVCLCKRCHGLTNFERTFWSSLFTAMISGSKLVRKDWGCEIWIVNNPKYCLKYLVFFKDQSFSYHWHLDKQELWYCMLGKLEALIEDDFGVSDNLIFKKSEKIELPPGVRHQLRAVENSILIEVSTQHFDEDSIRDNTIPEGD